MSELLFLSAFSGVAWRHTQSSSRCTTVSSILFEEVGEPKSLAETSSYTVACREQTHLTHVGLWCT